MVSRSALEMLLQGKEPAGPHGKRNVGNEGTEKSQATGWSLRKGLANGQELQFPNGYTVLAIQIEGQKSLIKGPQAWLNLLKAMEAGDIQAVVNDWLERISKGMEKMDPDAVVHHETPDRRSVPRDGEPDRVAALEAKVDGLFDKMEDLINKLTNQG